MARRIPWQRFFPTGSGLGDEAEDFLAGRFLDRTRSRGGSHRVEPWMWLNPVAHGSYESVRGIAAGAACARDDGQWHDMQVTVAREVHRRCDYNPRALSYLQRAVLVPLELRLIDDSEMTPEEVTATALRMLSVADR